MGARALLVTLCAASGAVDAQSPPASSVLVNHYYQSILGRAPDAGGAAYWQGQAALVQSLGADAKETWRTLAITFFGSAEYRSLSRSNDQYLADVYTTFFNRPPDAAGLAYWRGQLQSGLTRENLLLWFLFSAEFDGYMRGILGEVPARAEADVVIDFYRGFFARLPDEGGYRYWVARLRAAQCAGPAAVVQEVEALSNAFLTSPDYALRRRVDHEFLTDMYNAFLRRGADLPGFAEWGQRLRTGTYSRDAVRRAFVASAEFQARVQRVVAVGCYTQASESTMAVRVIDQSVSPFLATLELTGRNLEAITDVSFVVAPKPGTASRPVQATYSRAYLARSGYLSGSFRVPVFGLYAGHANTVAVQARFGDGSVAAVNAPVATAAWDDPRDIYDRPAFLARRAPGSSLGFDFFHVRGELTMPVVIDSDGEVRWWVPGEAYSVSTLFERNGFSAGVDMDLVRTELDGRTSVVPLALPYYRTHHSVDPGRTGILVEFDDLVDGVIDWEHILVEVAPDGTRIQEWRLADIIARHMRASGDDPSQFVRFGSDWFHMNAAAYDPRDDSVILSSRESFVIKVAYGTGEIKWILGDPTKYWYTFPSLRAKALTLLGGGLYPIGQHSVSVTPAGQLLLFNNGEASIQNPPGTSRGENRTFSVVSAYEVDPIALTATEVRRLDYNGLHSRFCSSVYESNGSWLVAYSRTADGTRARLVGVDASMGVVFDLEYVNPGGCNTAFSAAPVPFENLVFP